MNKSQYQWNPEKYHNSSSAQSKWAHELIAKLSLSGDERILDLGCGDGAVTAYIAGLVPKGEITGIDSSPDMIGFAKESYPSSQYPNLSFIQKDMQDIGFHEDFHVVFSNAALHWVRDHASLLKKIAQSLVPGGRILVQCGGEGNAKDFFDIAFPMIRKEPWNKYFTDFSTPYNFYSDVEYIGWLKAAGLKPVRVELLHKDMEQAGRDGIISWIHSTWLPFTERLPDIIKDEFVSTLADTYIKAHPADSRGVIHVRMVRLEVEAVREK